MFCYYYTLLLTTYNSVSWHHDPLLHFYTVELSMDICRVSGKSICQNAAVVRSLNFFIVNPSRDFGDEPSPTKPRRSDLARGS
jgi:hypothetical protein